MANPLRLHAAPDLSLFTGHLKDLKVNLALLTKHAEQQKDDFEPCTWARIQDQLQALEIALLGLECDTCSEFASSDRDAGQFCETCADRYVVCSGCGQDVARSEAVDIQDLDTFTSKTREPKYYHGVCAPDEFDR